MHDDANGLHFEKRSLAKHVVPAIPAVRARGSQQIFAPYEGNAVISFAVRARDAVQDRRLQGDQVSFVVVIARLTWSCFAGLFLSLLAISMPTLAVWGALSSHWAK
jgi:predicted dienelactone hydrolase